MKSSPKLLLAAALLLVLVGVSLAVLRPGSLGDEEAGTQTAQPAATETETETESESDAGAGPATGTETTGDGGAAAPTTTASAAPATTAAPGATTTTTSAPAGAVGRSGLVGGDVAAADTEDGLADTGGTSALGLVIVLGLAGLAVRRRTA